MNFSGYQAQAVLFAARPSRLALQQLELDVSGLRAVSINVWRNHAIEPVIALALPYLAYARCLADFHLSDYDDTLMFSGRPPADIELLWLDSSRFPDHSRFDDWLDWLIGRIKVLRTANPAPIIVATWLHDAGQWAQLQALTDAVPAIYFADLDAVCNEAGVMLAVLSTVLKRPFHDSADITSKNTRSWDSLKHIEIMFALEDELDMEFTEEGLVMLDCVTKIVDEVLAKHAA